jgi:hypothetical protein
MWGGLNVANSTAVYLRIALRIAGKTGKNLPVNLGSSSGEGLFSLLSFLGKLASIQAMSIARACRKWGMVVVYGPETLGDIGVGLHPRCPSLSGV